MITCQAQLFDLPDSITYLNGAYMAPQLKEITKIGIHNLKRKANPSNISGAAFFEQKALIKKRYSRLINNPDPDRIAIVASVSYGMANVVNNIDFASGDQIVVLDQQFPSNVYPWNTLVNTHNVTIVTVASPGLVNNRSELWTQSVIAAINPKTKVVALPHVHWADGTLLDLVAIRKKATEVGAYLIIDGTQSVGALPFNIEQIQPDALICAGYKWLLGPYSIGLAYYGPRFDNGTPIEHNWINRAGSEDFANLVNYQDQYKPKANRYDVGEASNFILLPMLLAAINQLLIWTPEAIQQYCKKITAAPLDVLSSKGFYVIPEHSRGHHLFGIYIPDGHHIEAIKARLDAHNIIVSYRGNAIRISPYVHNTQQQMEKLISCFI